MELSTERDVLALIWSVERRELWELAAVSRRQMTRFECLAVAQVRVSFTASVVAAVAAFAVLVGGVMQLVDQLLHAADVAQGHVFQLHGPRTRTAVPHDEAGPAGR